MNTIILILIFEIIPIILWALGWQFENNFSKYPDMTKGYKTKVSIKSEKIWKYANRLAGKMFSATGTLLFFIIALGLLIFQVGALFMLLIIVITLGSVILITNKMIRKKAKVIENN